MPFRTDEFRSDQIQLGDNLVVSLNSGDPLEGEDLSSAEKEEIEGVLGPGEEN